MSSSQLVEVPDPWLSVKTLPLLGVNQIAQKRILTNMNHLIFEDLANIWQACHKRKYPTYLFLALCFNLAIATTAAAATGDTFSRPQLYALSLLGLVAGSLSGYLFVVMFQPERF
jgi:K+-transporting ATPase KdpF subunit